MNLAWHFVGDKLRDGRPIPADGVWLEHEGPLKMCDSGLHFARQPFDALSYACGATTLCLVEIGGEVVEEKERKDCDPPPKGIASRRKIIARHDIAAFCDLKKDLEDARLAACAAISDKAANEAWEAIWDNARKKFNASVYEAFKDHMLTRANTEHP